MADQPGEPTEGDPLPDAEGRDVVDAAAGSDTPVEQVEAILERINPEERSEVIEAVMFHQGPMPPASMLAEYDKIVPGLAREIADGAADERRFRHRMTDRTGKQEFILQLAGLAAMLIALVMMLAIVAYCVASGFPVSGATLGAATIVGVTVALSNYRKSANTDMPGSAKDREPGK